MTRRWGRVMRGRKVASLAMALSIGLAACSPAPSAAPPTAIPSAPVPSPMSSSPAPTPSSTAIATASPAATPSPLPTPSPWPVADGWPYDTDAYILDAQFAPDGSVFTVEFIEVGVVRVVRHLAEGSVAAGWPWTLDAQDTSYADIALGPDSSVYVIESVEPIDGSPWRETLHRLDAGGSEMAGFPVKMPSLSSCGLHVADDGRAIVVCEGEDVAGSITEILPDGTTASGWPVTPRVTSWVIDVGRDGSVLLGTRVSADWRVSLLGPDGRPVPGWHLPSFPDLTEVGFDLAGRIRVVSWIYAEDEGECGPALSTTYAVLAADGRSAPGWPITIKGWGSRPVVRADGSMVVAASGHRLRAWSLAGRPLPGWPTHGIDIAAACSGGTDPTDAGAGGVVVVGDHHITRFDASGKMMPGWPVRQSWTQAVSCPLCTRGPSAPLSAGVTADTTFAAVDVGGDPDVVDLVGLDLHGRPLAGFPQRIAKPDLEVAWLRAGPDGRVWVLLWNDQGATGRTSSSLVPLTAAP
jgi:hypothetical protein